MVKKLNTSSRGIIDSVPEVESKKVAYMVRTFLNEYNNVFRVPATQKVSEKVDATVTTFLDEDRNGFRV
ncbi:hypothetical protein [Emticicia fontis]